MTARKSRGHQQESFIVGGAYDALDDALFNLSREEARQRIADLLAGGEGVDEISCYRVVNNHIEEFEFCSHGVKFEDE